ncbi:MAG: endonuclease/exonuclease/phosphatase family protein [Ignavibacteria bacterium]|nr:endonuclease/exonuclease/phosphatase family protein [Ignavibacteria bacterium]
MRIKIILITICMCMAVSQAQDPMSVSDAKKQVFGTIVSRVAGRVAVGGEFRNTSYIQDRTGGIAVFNAPFHLGVQVGDSVVIDSAVLTEFNQTTGAPGTGTSELSGELLRFTVVPVPRVVPSPRTTSLPIIGEDLEGQLVRVRNVKFIEQGSFQGEMNYGVVDENEGDFSIRLDGATEIATNSLPIPTTPVDLIGVIGQFRGTYQIFPRFASDVGLPPVQIDTVSKNRTIDMSTWNLNWYGSSDTTFGPSDKDRQRRSIRQVMDSMGVDLIALQEVLSQEALTAITDSLSGEYRSLLASDIASAQKMAYIYNASTIVPESNGLAVNGGAQAWAGGRFPYRFTFTTTIGGIVQQLAVFNIHAKATDSATALEDYSRRKIDAETFHAYLNDFYSDANIVVIGDFNDNLAGSVVDTSFESPYISFLADTASWSSPTYLLEQRGLSSYVGGLSSFIDHIIISNEVSPSHYRTFLESPQAYLSPYSSTVSDHLPVTMRLWPSGATGAGEEKSDAGIIVRISPHPCTDRSCIELTLEHEASVRVVLVDALGHSVLLLEESLSPQVRLIPIPVNNLTTGLYQVLVQSNNSIIRRPVVVKK